MSQRHVTQQFSRTISSRLAFLLWASGLLSRKADLPWLHPLGVLCLRRREGFQTDGRLGGGTLAGSAALLLSRMLAGHCREPLERNAG